MFDPFNDFSTAGYLRNKYREMGHRIVKEIEHEIFTRQRPKAVQYLSDKDTPGDQTDNPTDAGVQVISVRANHHCRYRDDAHDPQGADGLPRRQNHVCSQPVLQPRCLITRSATQLLSARVHYCDRTQIS